MNLKYSNLINDYYAVKNSSLISYSFSKTGFIKSDIFLFRDKESNLSPSKIFFDKYEISNIRLWKRNRFRVNLQNGISVQLSWSY
jgi:hypothetical protein